MAEDKSTLSHAERASLLLLAVGQERAAAVLKHMGPKEVQIIGGTMAQLGPISSEMVDGVLEEFIIEIKNETGLGMDSDEYIRNMLTNALGADKAGSIIDRILLGANSKGIEQLKWMDTRSIADLIRLEHPQIISIILTLLDPDQAADVLTLLPQGMRSDILMRIATLEGVQPAALRELDEIMEKQLTGSDGVKSSQIGGVEAAANILNFIESSISEPMMQDINENNADLAQRIQDKMFIFGDLLNVDDRGIQTLLREVSTDQLLLALRGVDAALRDKVFANMSRRAADMLRDDLEAAPPARLSEVEAAQKDILSIAKRLADAGELALAGGGGDDFV
ncbi:MAG: flagellar motor switch protein FliG [Methylomonas lenta]|nr:flagellar motor switch protein FliG [Methylomonas lenta]